MDTSVLLASLSTKHPLSQLATKVITEARQKGNLATTTLHTYGELYNHLSRPGHGRANLSLEDTSIILLESVPSMFKIVELTRADYESAVQRCVSLGLVGPVIYDALHFQAALKAEAEVIYTDNLRDFTRLLKPEDAIRVEGIRG